VRSKILPLFLLFREEIQKARIIPQVIEVGVMLEQGITWETIFRCHLQVVQGFLSLVQQRVG